MKDLVVDDMSVGCAYDRSKRGHLATVYPMRAKKSSREEFPWV